MNNLLPWDIKIDHRFELKGSTIARHADPEELEKANPTLKDLDFHSSEFWEGML